MSPLPALVLIEQRGFQRCYTRIQIALRGPAGKTEIAKETWEASFCLTGQGILSKKGISFSSRRLPTIWCKGYSVTPHTPARKKFIFRSASLYTFYSNSTSSVKVCTHKMHPLHWQSYFFVTISYHAHKVIELDLMMKQT